MVDFIDLPDGEKWIKGYEGLYSCTIEGKIFSYHKNFKTEKKIYFLNRNMEYPSVRLRKNGKDKALKIHRIVMMTFVHNPENKPCVNHIDGDKSNYNINNLEWVTYSENQKHAHDTGLKQTNPIAHFERMHQLTVNTRGYFTKEEADIIIRFKEMFGLSNKRIADMFRCSENVIGGIVRGDVKYFREDSIFIKKEIMKGSE